ncbi:unnamed protein product [Malus baccata var. baccata]
MVQEINRREQQILGGVLVKNLRQLVKARIDEEIRGTLVRFSDTAPGPGTKRSVKIEKTRMGLRVYGRGANRNKLVVHTMYPPANRSNPPKEKVPLDKTLSQRFLGFSNGIHGFGSWKKVGVLLLLLASAATAFGVLNGDAVHATINSRDMHYFFNHLRVGEAYEINKFRVVHNRTSSKVVPHAAIIELNSKTTIVPIDKTSQEIPMHWFNLIELEQLYERIDRDVELTDIFGCLTAVQPIEEITIQRTRIAKKRNLNLQNIRGEIVRITLWGETATNFEDSGIQSLLPPVFVALTGLKVKQYQGKPVLGSTGSTVYFFNPDIPQLSEYKRRFEHLKSPLRILPSSTDMYTGHAIGADSEPKTIDELLLLDPTLHKNASFTCKATVVDFNLARGWWYNSCPSCHKVVKKMSGSFQCNEHGLINKLPEPCRKDAWHFLLHFGDREWT